MTPERRDDLAETIHRDEWHGALDTFTVDLTIRLYVRAGDEAHARDEAVRLYASWSPDGIGQYADVIARRGYWYLCAHGDETDAMVWDPRAHHATTEGVGS